MEHCSRSWNVVVFTASNRAYAENMLDRLDPEGYYVQNILSRENCYLYGMRFVKDFRMIVNSSYKTTGMLLLDNKVCSFGFNMDNGMPILPFTGQGDDTELKFILPVLDYLSQPHVNIAEYVTSRFKYEELLKVSIK